MHLFKVIIAGTRNFNDYSILCEYVDRMLVNKKNSDDIVIVSGHCRGADALGERYANERGYAIEMYPPDWEKYGKSAGVRRNREMANNANALIAFWDGKSRGTKNMIEEARACGLLVRVKIYD